MKKQEEQITVLKGIGTKKSEAFSACGINTILQLLEYYPVRYEYYNFCNSPDEIINGGKTVFYVTYNGTVTRQYAKNVGIFVRWRIKSQKRDVLLTWFNQPYIASTLEKGRTYCIKCDLELKNGIWQAVNPKFSATAKYKDGIMEPVYKNIQGIGTAELRKFIKEAIEYINDGEIKDTIPDDIREKYSVPGYIESLKSIHLPKNEEDCIIGNKRLIFEEFYMFKLRQKLSQAKRSTKDASVDFDVNCIENFKSKLTYNLTPAQENAITDIAKDLKDKKPMNRIVQGDVGSGKTVVAFAACLMAKNAGFQSIIMAPTEVLARQHEESFQKTFSEMNINSALLVGSMKQSEKKQTAQDFASGKIDVLIGTHAVLEDNIVSENVGLVVTDEQHRFGVKQRLNLKNKGRPVNMLVMTATPIPRTLSMVIYGDLDVSVIDQMPPGRTPVKTYAVNGTMRERIYKFAVKQVKEGRQVYIVCPLIDDDDESKASVKKYFGNLSNNELKDVNTGMLYGAMKPSEKDAVMNDFATGKTDVLISTTVIEVGINVPNATVMIIEDAEKFGLAQLHQLRGRVGRGSEQSYCILISDSEGKIAKERLSALVKTTDGFKIAEDDMKLRGQGEYFGLRQHGNSQFKYGVLPRDTVIFAQASNAVEYVAENADKYAEFYKNAYEKAKRLNEEIVFN